MVHSRMTLPVTDASMGPLNKPFLVRANSARISAVNTRDTLIASEPCRIHPAYRNRADAYVPYKPVLDGTAASLHDLVCRWAVDEDLSIDSTRLPSYVRVMSDTLRLAEDAFAYAVHLRPPADAPPHIPTTLYVVAQVGDSLYYRDLIDTDPRRNRSVGSIRALRLLEVPGSNAQYFWVETKRVATSTSDRLTRTVERWYGNVLTYDRERGVRYLRGSVVRREVRHDGAVHGAAQLDVSIPEPGIMEVGERLRRGADVTKGYGWYDWMGVYVIDSSAVSDSSRYRYLLEEQAPWRR